MTAQKQEKFLIFGDLQNIVVLLRKLALAASANRLRGAFYLA
jgi:hypothetical protein